MWNFLVEFTDEESELCGEQIFVQCDTYEEADEIVAQYFEGEGYCYHGRFTDDEAEEMGYDTY